MKFTYRCLINRRQTVSQSLVTTIKSLLVPIVALAVVMAAPQVAAQEALTGSISGRIVSPASGASMSGVLLRITETGATTSTARDGRFRFGGLPAGNYSIEMSYLGLDSRGRASGVGSRREAVEGNRVWSSHHRRSDRTRYPRSTGGGPQ